MEEYVYVYKGQPSSEKTKGQATKIFKDID